MEITLRMPDYTPVKVKATKIKIKGFEQFQFAYHNGLDVDGCAVL